jgi:hypothetical protein
MVAPLGRWLFRCKVLCLLWTEWVEGFWVTGCCARKMVKDANAQKIATMLILNVFIFIFP